MHLSAFAIYVKSKLTGFLPLASRLIAVIRSILRLAILLDKALTAGRSRRFGHKVRHTC